MKVWAVFKIEFDAEGEPHTELERLHLSQPIDIRVYPVSTHGVPAHHTYGDLLCEEIEVQS